MRSKAPSRPRVGSNRLLERSEEQGFCTCHRGSGDASANNVPVARRRQFHPNPRQQRPFQMDLRCQSREQRPRQDRWSPLNKARRPAPPLSTARPQQAEVFAVSLSALAARLALPAPLAAGLSRLTTLPIAGSRLAATEAAFAEAPAAEIGASKSATTLLIAMIATRMGAAIDASP